MMAALALSERTARLAGADPVKLWDAGVFTAIAAFVVSRLVLAAEYWNNFKTFPILLLTVPSLTATGLLLTAMVSAAWLWWKRVPLLRALDAWAPCAMVVWGFLALGHFAEGSDPGMVNKLPWAMPTARGDVLRAHPVALYVAFAAFSLAIMAMRLLRTGKKPGAAAGRTMAGAGLAQFVITFVRQPGQMLPGGLEALQWVGLGMMVVGIALITAPAIRRLTM